MRLAGEVAREEHPVGEAGPEAWPDGTCGQPMSLKLRAVECFANSFAAREDVLKSRFRCSASGLCFTAALQRIATNAEGNADASRATVDHAAITAGKDHEWHQVWRELRFPEMRLECQQIGTAMRLISCVGQTVPFPRANRRNDCSRFELVGPISRRQQ